MLKHKRSLHKYVRGVVEEDFLKELSEETSDIVCALKKVDGEYLCVTTTGDVMWTELPPSHPARLDFQKKIKFSESVLISDLKSWVMHEV